MQPFKQRSPRWPRELRRLLLINAALLVVSLAVVIAIVVTSGVQSLHRVIWSAVATTLVACLIMSKATSALNRRQHAEVRRRFERLFQPLPSPLDLLPPIDQLAHAFDAHYAAAREDKARLTTVLASMSDGLIATDHQQRVLLINAAAGELLGLMPAVATGQMLWDVVRNDRIIEAVAEVSLTGQRKVISLGPVQERYLEVMVCRLPLRPAGFVVVARDITEARRYEELRKEFVANVSHELRTPLTMIKGFVDTLLNGALSDPARAMQYLATVQRHSDQLERLVVDLLSLSRLDSPNAAPTMQPLHLDDVALRVVEQLAPAADRKGQVLALRAADGCSAIMGDEAQLERALINLIDNAIKYAGSGGRIEVVVAEEGAHATVQVIDNGPGIAPADQPRIFERFYRVDRSRSREMGGTGLGLSIVKHIAQAHGGSVEVASAPGNGSAFTLRIPRGRSARG